MPNLLELVMRRINVVGALLLCGFSRGQLFHTTFYLQVRACTDSGEQVDGKKLYNGFQWHLTLVILL